MKLSTIRMQALTRYGNTAARYGTEDELFPRAVMHDLINEAHRWLAEQTLCYRLRDEYDLPLGSGGKSSVALDCNVICLDDFTLRIQYGGTWRTLEYVDEEELYDTFDALEQTSNGVPQYYYLRMGSAIDAQQYLELYPGSDTAVTSGVRVEAYIYPALMSAETDSPALQPGYHPKLIPAICWKMAEMDLSRGVRDAPVLYWKGEAQQAAQELKDLIDLAKRPEPRRVRHIDTDAYY